MYQRTVGYISKTDPFADRKAWSGTTYKIREAIEQAGYHVKWIPYKTPQISKIIQGLCFLYTRLTGKTVVHSHLPLIGRLEARSIDKKEMEPCDILFFCGSSQVLSYFETGKPVYYLSDTTFELMIGYYWRNLAAWSIEFGNRIEQRALDRASVIIHSSAWASNSARDYYHIPANKLQVIEFGANIDEKEISDTRRQSPADVGEGTPLRVLFSGVEWERKGGDIAADTIVRLNEAGIGAVLYVVGIKNLPKKHATNPYIEHIGFLNKNIPEQYHRYVQLWQQADLLLLPTRAECAGIVYCEAAGYGVPVFTTDTGGVPNYVENGNNGYRLPLSGTGADFADKIAECIRREELSVLSANARRLYREKLSWKAWSTRFSEIVETFPGYERKL